MAWLVTASAPGRVRRTVSSSLTPATLRACAELLAGFHARFDRCGSDVERFALLIDEMFDVFTNQDRELDPATGGSVFALPVEDNLDTGNPMAEPFPAFVEEFARGAREPGEYRSYHGPEAIPALVGAARRFLVGHGLVEPTLAERLDVAVGAGTAHLYDCVCRLLVVRPGDVVILPAVTYGYFIPQVERAGGRVEMLAGGADTKIDPGSLDRLIAGVNARGRETWLAGCDWRLRLYAREVSDETGLELRKPRRAELDALRRALHQAGPSSWDAAVAGFVREAMLGGDAEKLARLTAVPRHRPPRPPRAVGLLHINPNIYGAVYDDAETAALATVLRRHDVTVVEDIAYHSLRQPLASLPTFLRHEVRCYSLFGVSKPFAISNCRAGIAIGSPPDIYALTRMIENTIGFQSSMVQRALAATLDGDPEELARYFAAANQGADGYELKRHLTISCLEGVGSERLPRAVRDECAERIRAEIGTLFAEKRALGVTVCDPAFLGRRGIAAGDDGARFAEVATDRFLAGGLGRWLTLRHDPAAGFFVVVDCSAVIERGPLGGIPVASSFDVFAILAYLFGVRTIPEEAMVVPDMAGGRVVGRCTQLRLTFSCEVRTIVRALFTAYVGLEQLAGISSA